MNNRDRLASQSDDLASFVSEAAIGATSLESEQPRDPLWDFLPEEALLSAAAAPHVPPTRKLSNYASYASLAAAILIAVVAGAWWGELIPGNRPVATAATLPANRDRAGREAAPRHVESATRGALCICGIATLDSAARGKHRPEWCLAEDAARIERPPPKPVTVALSGAASERRQASSEAPRCREERVVMRRWRRCLHPDPGRRPSRYRRLQWPPWRTQR